MDEQTREVVRACTVDSDEQRAPFPQIVGRLMDAGVERYHADLRRSVKTYYLPSGDAEEVRGHPIAAPFAQAFSAAGVEAAVRASQRGEIGYRAFCTRIAEAGCVGYFVSIVGRRAVYYGRTGETHVELFPSAP